MNAVPGFTIIERIPGYDTVRVRKDGAAHDLVLPAFDIVRDGMAAAWDRADLQLENRVLREEIADQEVTIQTLRDQLPPDETVSTPDPEPT